MSREERSIFRVGVDWDRFSIPPKGGYLEADSSGGQTSINEAEAEAVADLFLALHIGRWP